MVKKQSLDAALCPRLWLFPWPNSFQDLKYTFQFLDKIQLARENAGIQHDMPAAIGVLSLLCTHQRTLLSVLGAGAWFESSSLATVLGKVGRSLLGNEADNHVKSVF